MAVKNNRGNVFKVPVTAGAVNIDLTEFELIEIKLDSLLKELKIMNVHLSLLTDTTISREEIE